MSEDKKELDTREFEKLPLVLMTVDEFVKKNYLAKLSECDVEPIPENLEEFSIIKCVRLLKIQRIVYDKTEDIGNKLVNVYSSILNNDTSLIMIIDSDGINNDIYIGVKERETNKNISTAKETLEKAIGGNFPGLEYTSIDNEGTEELARKVTETKYVSSVTGIPSLKNEGKEKFSQGMEKLIEGMKGEQYTAIFIADPISMQEIEKIKYGYENLYTQLVPFAESQLSFGENDTKSVTEGMTKGITETLSNSIADSNSIAEGNSDGKSKTKNYGGAVQGLSVGIGAGIGSIIPGIGTMIGGVIGGSVGSIAAAIMESTTTSDIKSTTANKSQINTGTVSIADSKQKNDSNTDSKGTSKQLQIKFENKSIKELLENIEGQLKRIKESEDFGMWNCGTYFISDNFNTAKVASNKFKAIIRGEESGLEKSYINSWDLENKVQNMLRVKEYIKIFHHPIMNLNTGIPHVYL